jgi:uncharacterized protein (DUF1499 family)
MSLLVAAALIVLAFAVLGWWSQRPHQRVPGIVEGRLAPCYPAPRCVCSEHTGAHAIAPLALDPGDEEGGWNRLVEGVVATGGTIVLQHDGYLHATFVSRWFRFVDDLELRRVGGIVHVRSTSRVGYSDLGVNRKRVERLRARLND